MLCELLSFLSQGADPNHHNPDQFECLLQRNHQRFLMKIQKSRPVFGKSCNKIYQHHHLILFMLTLKQPQILDTC